MLEDGRAHRMGTTVRACKNGGVVRSSCFAGFHHHLLGVKVGHRQHHHHHHHHHQNDNTNNNAINIFTHVRTVAGEEGTATVTSEGGESSVCGLMASGPSICMICACGGGDDEKNEG